MEQAVLRSEATFGQKPGRKTIAAVSSTRFLLQHMLPPAEAFPQQKQHSSYYRAASNQGLTQFFTTGLPRRNSARRYGVDQLDLDAGNSVAQVARLSGQRWSIPNGMLIDFSGHGRPCTAKLFKRNPSSG
jgi:hypothetical protein